MVVKQCKTPLYFGLTSRPSLTAGKNTQVRRGAGSVGHRQHTIRSVKEIGSRGQSQAEEILSGIVSILN